VVLEERMGSKLWKHVRLIYMWCEDKNLTNVFVLDSQSKSTIVNIATAEETRRNDDWFAEADDPKRYG